MNKNDVIQLVTHNGAIHGDDLFACATFCLYLEKIGKEYKIIRSRDNETIKRGDYVFDVGGVYDPTKNRFDHHQKEGSGRRENGVPYASFGLVWKHFGLEICGGDNEVWQRIDNEIAGPIDALDNGMDIVESKVPGLRPYNAERTFLVFSPTWQEESANIDEVFKNEVKNIMRLLKREIEVMHADVVARRIILEAYEKAKDKRIIELPKNFPRYLYQDTLSRLPEPIYMICHSRFSDTWKIEAISKSPNTMESRKPFPESWRVGINNDPNLPIVSGVPDATFCHRSGFLADVDSREGAYKFAEKALQNKQKTKWRLWTK